MALGAATLAGKAATVLSGVGSIPSGLASALGTFGSAAPGIGLAASGIIGAYESKTNAGKAAGTAEGVGGGAMAGAIIGSVIPGIGTLIGAGVGALVGAVGGIVASVFGGPSNFTQGVQNAMYRNQYHAPSSENFSFASNGSIANTLQTGFQQSGGKFSQYALPSNTPSYASALTGKLTWQQLYQVQNSGLNPNAPFLGNPASDPFVGQGPVGRKATTPPPAVNVTVAIPGLIDSNQLASTLAPHLTSISQMVSKQVSSSARITKNLEIPGDWAKETGFTVQYSFHREHQICPEVKLIDEALNTEFFQLPGEQVDFVPAHNDRARAVSKDCSCGFDAVQSRHLNIQNGQVREEFLGDINCLLTVRR
jgi:hypothetical protein